MHLFMCLSPSISTSVYMFTFLFISKSFQISATRHVSTCVYAWPYLYVFTFSFLCTIMFLNTSASPYLLRPPGFSSLHTFTSVSYVPQRVLYLHSSASVNTSPLSLRSYISQATSLNISVSLYVPPQLCLLPHSHSSSISPY